MNNPLHDRPKSEIVEHILLQFKECDRINRNKKRRKKRREKKCQYT